MKKTLTISIAAYNVEKFLKKTLDSLIVDNMEKLEVLIVNDGSKDNTTKIAKEYCKKYPNCFKLIDKKNGGYGSTINASIKKATGKYFKQLDGDDWYDNNNLKKYLDDLEKCDSDIVYTPLLQYYEYNGKYEEYEDKVKVENGTYKLNEVIKDFPIIKMHSLAFKTEILQKNNILITEHCFYTDTQYVLFPLLFSRTITIYDYPIYIYRLGLEDQSVSIKGKLKHYQDHVKADYDIMKFMTNNRRIKISKNIDKYICQYLVMLFSSCIGKYLMVVKPSKEQYKYIREYDNKVLEYSKDVYNGMQEYSKAVKILRNNSYTQYKMLYYIKRLLKRF